MGNATIKRSVLEKELIYDIMIRYKKLNKRQERMKSTSIVILAVSVTIGIVISLLYIHLSNQVKLPTNLAHIHQLTGNVLSSKESGIIKTPSFIVIDLSIVALAAGLGISMVEMTLIPLAVSLGFIIMIYFAPFMLANYESVTNHKIERPEINKVYVAAQKMVKNGLYIHQKQQFDRYVSEIDTISSKYKPNPKVVYVLDIKAFGHPESAIAKEYESSKAKERKAMRPFLHWLGIAKKIPSLPILVGAFLILVDKIITANLKRTKDLLSEYYRFPPVFTKNVSNS